MLCILYVRNGERYGGVRVRAGEHRRSVLSRSIGRAESSKCEKIFQEKISGAWSDRKQLTRLMAILSKGDVLVVTRLDRLARCRRIFPPGSSNRTGGREGGDHGRGAGTERCKGGRGSRCGSRTPVLDLQEEQGRFRRTTRRSEASSWPCWESPRRRSRSTITICTRRTGLSAVWRSSSRLCAHLRPLQQHPHATSRPRLG